MTAARRHALETSDELTSDRYAAGRPSPYLVVDLDASEIVAASEAAAETIGLFAYASFPIAVDPTMPAMVRLRQLAPTLAEPVNECLMFRFGGRLRPLTFKISKPASHSRSPQILLEIIEEAMESHGETVEPKAGLKEGEAAAYLLDPATAAPPRTDAETLKEIARQIREGRFSFPRNDEPKAPKPNVGNGSDRSPPAVAARKPEPDLAQRKPLPALDPDYLAHLAHELKTPLTAIAVAAEVMRDERLGSMGNARYLAYASDIHESAHHALDVIASLLTESGKAEETLARLIALDLNAIVARTVSSVQALAETHGLTLAFEGERSKPHVIANPTAIRQILLNLLTNAIKFTPKGGDIRVVTGYLDDGRVFLVVRDTGCGISGELPADSRKESASAPNFSAGRGIGLPLVRRLVSEMGADLSIDSAPGKGTVVLISFGGYASWPQRR